MGLAIFFILVEHLLVEYLLVEGCASKSFRMNDWS